MINLSQPVWVFHFTSHFKNSKCSKSVGKHRQSVASQSALMWKTLKLPLCRTLLPTISLCMKNSENWKEEFYASSLEDKAHSFYSCCYFSTSPKTNESFSWVMCTFFSFCGPCAAMPRSSEGSSSWLASAIILVGVEETWCTTSVVPQAIDSQCWEDRQSWPDLTENHLFFFGLKLCPYVEACVGPAEKGYLVLTKKWASSGQWTLNCQEC